MSNGGRGKPTSFFCCKKNQPKEPAIHPTPPTPTPVTPDHPTLSDLKQLAQTPGFAQADAQTRHQLLIRFVAHHPAVELAYMTDTHGVQNVANAAAKNTRVAYVGDGVGENRSHRAWFSIPARTGKPHVTRRYVSVATHGLCVTVSAPVFDRQGELVGVLAADLRVEEP